MTTRNIDKEQFYAEVVAGRPAIWEIAAGVSFCTRRECMDWGLALQVDWHNLGPSQFGEALERRFDDPERYHDYFLFLDSRREFVIWRCLPGELDRAALDEISTHQLQLMGLEHLGKSLARH
ncbi:type III secretion protein HrpV [Pseudomonas congelans]|uniref:type III secretion protein HrpV n=1 Tax=Pseudomonas congelans TaxID=200452 RepID=UPI000BB66FAC|nr:type III secretion protein HrpV [Pseudomonas congelans]PBP93703.1 hypothetical protein CCL17_26600 [Pseudomonas congelans]PBQ00751.1 hypothetical protein CCL24_01320 [Pseudomonas congelans]PBQ16175.1 hypothetical protein CCL08_16640 [Pseudomonas congelans]QVX09750.1 type III secretion protein HrpV [Pseudomonas congelans]